MRAKVKKKFNKAWIPLMLLAPAILFYLLFWIFPVVMGVVESFTTEYGSFTMDNYVNIFKVGKFGLAILNTATFVVFSLIVQYVLALIMALILAKPFRGSKVIMFIVMIPMAITPTAVAILWKTGLMQTGWINSILSTLHLQNEQYLWLESRGFSAIIMLCTIDTWTVLPSVMIILLAGLQNMQKEYKEAAYVFGATRWQILKDVTIPLLKPAIVTSLILRMIAATQVWALVVMVMGMGTLPFMVERIAYYVDFVSNVDGAQKMAYAMSVVVAVIVFAASVVYYKLSRRKSIMEATDAK